MLRFTPKYAAGSTLPTSLQARCCANPPAIIMAEDQAHFPVSTQRHFRVIWPARTTILSLTGSSTERLSRRQKRYGR